MKRRKKLLYICATSASVYLLAVVISAIVSWCESAPRPLSARAAGAQQLRVMSFNVNYGEAPARSSDAIAKGDADIVCLQESTKEWEEFAGSTLKAKYPYVIFHHEE